jgi:type I restriction enzyme, S subunit
MAVKSGYKQTEVGVIPEEWDARRVCEFASVITGGTPRTEVQAYWDGDYPWVTPTDITDQRDMWASERMISESGLGSIRQLPANAVLVTCIASIGKNAILRSVGGCNQQINAVVPKQENSPEFLYYTFESSKQYLLANAGMTATRILSKAAFEQLKFSIPPLPEQRAIAESLSDVDGLLGGLDRLIAKKRDLKQAAMQQLLTGQTRLPGFHGTWETSRLGSLASLSKGAQLHSSETNETGKFAHLNGGITPSGYTHKSNVAANTIAISEGGNSCGFVQFMTEPYWCGGHCYSVIPQAIDNRFLYHALKGQQSGIMALRVGSGLPNVQKTALLAFELQYPVNSTEQTAIAEVLTAMDAELTALEQRREKTRALKQAMMQELLTGRTRLV